MTEEDIKKSLYIEERENKYVENLLKEMKPKLSIIPEP
jgi:hypothetical protein